MCDAAYLCQIETLEREALAQVVLLPHMEEKDRKQWRSVDQVIADFDEWLVSEIVEQVMTPEDQEQLLMYRFLGVGKK